MPAAFAHAVEVERELTRVRGEVEQTQGRMQKLSKLSELTTITVTVTEQKDYVPPTSPTFSSTDGRTLGESADALVQVCRFLALVVVALLPWLPLIALVCGTAWWRWRRLRRAASVTAPPTEQVNPT